MGHLECMTTWQGARLPTHQAGTAFCHCQEVLQVTAVQTEQKRKGSLGNNCSTERAQEISMA